MKLRLFQLEPVRHFILTYHRSFRPYSSFWLQNLTLTVYDIRLNTMMCQCSVDSVVKSANSTSWPRSVIIIITLCPIYFRLRAAILDFSQTRISNSLRIRFPTITKLYDSFCDKAHNTSCINIDGR